MKYKCVFCGKDVERFGLEANGFCDDCNTAQKYADETIKKLLGIL